MSAAPGGIAASRPTPACAPHRRFWVPTMVQDVAPPGVLDLRLGYLDPDLLPVRLVAEAYQEALDHYGAAALSYGADPGALELRELLADRARKADGTPCSAADVLLTAGSSQALYLLAHELGAPGDTVLVEATHYNLARRLLVDCGLEVRPVPGDEHGMEPIELHRALVAAAHEGRRVAFAYLVPTFHNPTGRVMPERRRREVLHVARRYNLLLVEDDAYADLPLEPAARRPRSLAALAGCRGVVRLCTFSKTLGAGLRLGWLVADESLAERLSSHGLFQSGGSLNHLASLAATVLLRSGRYDRHLAQLRPALRARRDRLVESLGGLAGHLAEVPAGGFFAWLRFDPSVPEQDVVQAATGAGIRVARGSWFGATPETCVRLSYSFLGPDELTRAGRALRGAWQALTPPPERIRS